MLRVYHEPHGNHDTAFLRRYARDSAGIDTVITPIRSARIAPLGGFPLVNGVSEAVALCALVRPRRVVGFINGRGEMEGVLSRIMKGDELRDGPENFRRALVDLEGLEEMEIVDDYDTMVPFVVADRNNA